MLWAHSMEIRLAETAGFCFGVDRAVSMAQAATQEAGACYMLGKVIHNDAVLGGLRQNGACLVEDTAQVPAGSRVILRSHGALRQDVEVLTEKRCAIVDTVCPCVSRIHHLVADADRMGRTALIFGSASHPEVAASASNSSQSLVVSSVNELEAWLSQKPNHLSLPITLVAQTTALRENFKQCAEMLKKLCTNVEIFDTICDATSTRQTEAVALAKQCDAMIVVGDRHSSNTKHLYELCLDSCPQVYWVQEADPQLCSRMKDCKVVGITAGASTPQWIIKEVYKTMSEEIMEIEESFAELLEKSIKTLHTGEKVTGVVTGIAPTEIYVDLGTKHAGYIPVSELTDDQTVDPFSLVTIGEEIETFVVRVNDQEGVITLSKKRLDVVKNWEEVEKACEEKITVEGIVTEENKGGIVVSVKGVRVFVPASQTGLPRDAEMSQMLKEKVKLRIREVNRARRRVVGSIRAVGDEIRAEAAAAVWAEIEPGKKYAGTVKSLTSYGAFVDIGGVDGMVHISELTWSRVKHPSEVVKVGDQVEVFVISADAEKKKISLGMKDRAQSPWATFTEKYAIGDVAAVKVVKFMTFGAFAEIVPGVDGLIHISQIADRRIDAPGDALTEGETVDAKIIDIDMDNKKVSLSIRALLNAPVEEVPAEEAPCCEETGCCEAAPAEEAPCCAAPAEEVAEETAE
jgi:(E)-4-hydroxy-3-methyl-but-2-enyl pyrophosphate reductase (IPP and DMAPP forming)